MMTIAYWMMLIGGLVALAFGLLVLVKGDAMRAADVRAGRVGPSTPSLESLKRSARIAAILGAVAIAAALFLF